MFSTEAAHVSSPLLVLDPAHAAAADPAADPANDHDPAHAHAHDPDAEYDSDPDRDIDAAQNQAWLKTVLI